MSRDLYSSNLQDIRYKKRMRAIERQQLQARQQKLPRNIGGEPATAGAAATAPAAAEELP